jgi:hypothetical protein
VTPSRWVLWIIIGAFLAPAVFPTQADPDLWGNVRFGLDVLHDRAPSRVDRYSFTQDIPWVNHEWLSELFMGTAYRVAGPIGLAVLKGTLVLLVFLVVLGPYRNGSALLIGAVFLVLVVGTGRVSGTLRPQLWSLLATGILCRWLMNGPRRWWLVAIPAVFLLWVNAHGGWVVGAGILAVWTAARFLTDRSSRTLLAGVGVLSMLATLVNPYGWHMWEFLGATVRMTRPVTEWQPLLTTPVVAWIPWFVAGVAVALSIGSPNRPSIGPLAIAAALAYASFRVERLSPFYVASTLVFLSPALVSRWPSRIRAFNPISRRTAAALGAVLAAGCLVSAVLTAKASSCITIGGGEWVPDRLAGRALVDAHVKGRMVTWFDWGHYAIWHLSPSIRVSLDGRRETIYSDAVLRNHDQMDAGTPEGLAYLQSLNPDYVWLPSWWTRVRGWLATHGYRIDVDTARSFVAVRSDLPVVMVSDRPLGGCFPGP